VVLSGCDRHEGIMQSGLGDQVECSDSESQSCALPGVGQNFQDKPSIGCIREYQNRLPPRNIAGEQLSSEKSNLVSTHQTSAA